MHQSPDTPFLPQLCLNLGLGLRITDICDIARITTALGLINTHGPLSGLATRAWLDASFRW